MQKDSSGLIAVILAGLVFLGSTTFRTRRGDPKSRRYQVISR